MSFQEKSLEQLKGLEAEELQAYYIEKLTHEKQQINERVKALENEKNSENFAKLETELQDLKSNKINTLLEAVKQQGVILEKVKNGNIKGDQVFTLEQAVKQALSVHRDDFLKAKDGRHNFKFSLKVAGDMTLAGNVSGGTVPQPQRIDGVNNIAERETRILPIVSRLNTDRNSIEWVYETNQDGTSSGVAEGAAKDQLDNDFVVASISLKKRAVYFKVSTEMLDDVSFMEGWLRNKLIVRLLLDVDNQVLDGDATGQNLNGIVTQATAFAAGTFANTVDQANDVDSLVVAANQIRIANHMGALTIVMHPSDVTALKLIKLTATDKRYVNRLLQVGSTMTMDGIPIVETTAITAGDFLIGDFSKATVVQKRDVMVELGLDGNDFTNNMRTILAEWRGEVLIQNNDTTAFVTGTFATTNAALETP